MITGEQLKAVLVLVVPQVVGLVAARQGVSEKEATAAFYRSRTYEVLANKQTDVWHFSPEALYDMFAGEQACGYVTFPEEAA